MENINKIFIMVIVGSIAFIQAGAWYMGFNGQVTVMLTGIITYLMGLLTKPAITKVLKK